MTRLQKLQNQKAALLAKLRAMNDAADQVSEGVLTAEQETEYKGFEAQLSRLNETIAAEERLRAAELVAPAVESALANGERASRVTATLRGEADPARGFRTPREFLLSVMKNRGQSREQIRDERLQPLAVLDDNDEAADGAGLIFMMPKAFTPPSILGAAGSDEQGGYADDVGGFLRQTTVLPGLLQVGMEGDPTTTQGVPMATPIVKLPARVDKDHTSSVSGGFTVSRSAETVAKTATRAKFEMVALEAASLFGLAFATEEILTDSPISFIALIDAGFRDQFAHEILSEKIRGKGGDQYIGVLDAANGSLITVAKESAQAADTIVAANVVKMRARCWGYSQAIWLANHDTLPELVKVHLAGTNGDVFLFAPGNGTDKPDTLLGRAIFFTEYAATLGDKGDLILGNWSQFLEGTYQPLQSAESMHVRFLNHERAFKFWVRNAGAPWWRTALTPHKGPNTLSPFVTLADRA